MAIPLRIAGITLLFIAFFLSFLVSISLPTLRALDIVRTVATQPSIISQSTKELRLGIWSACYYDQTGDSQCLPKHHGYTAPLIELAGGRIFAVGSSWTRGLAMHPVAAALAFIAFCLSFTKKGLVTVLVTALAFVMTLLSFAVDIALYAEAHHVYGQIQNGLMNTNTAPGFWLTFVSLILLIVAGVLVLIDHRKGSDYPSYPMSNAKPSWLAFLKK